MTSLHNDQGSFWLAALLPTTATILIFFHHPWVFLVLLVVLVPAADALIGRDAKCVNQGASRASIGPAVPITYICLWGSGVLVATERATTARAMEFTGVVVTIGVLSGFAMAHIHEVMHRTERGSRLISDFALSVAGYPHYRGVHQLHHRHVGDPRFGSTAHVGLSVWRHVGWSFFAALRSVVTDELSRAQHWKANKLLQMVFVIIAIVSVFAWLAGWRGVALYVGQSVISVFIVEAVGYIQHYGLYGCPDELSSQVAWDVNFWLSNRLFANNGYHTHHHLEQTLTYDRLIQIGKPLPGGYLHMFGLALIPQLWFVVMNQRLPQGVGHSTKHSSPQD